MPVTYIVNDTYIHATNDLTSFNYIPQTHTHTIQIKFEGTERYTWRELLLQ